MLKRSPRISGWGIVLCSLAIFPLLVAGCDSGDSETASIIGRQIDVATSDWAGVARGHEFVCGIVSPQDLTASMTMDIGNLTISNDENFLYVEVNPNAPRVLGKVRVHVGFAASEVPQDGDGVRSDLFDYKHERNVNGGEPAVPSDEFAILLTDLNIDINSCGTTLYIWATTSAFLLEDDNTVIEERTTWGGDTPGTIGTRWYFEAIYTLQCCGNGNGDNGEFRTQSQGGYGTYCHGENPGCYRNEWFDVAFPGGIEIGCTDGFTATFTSSEAVRDFLPSGGAPGSLTSDLVDPTEKTDAGVLLAQLLALELSLAFDIVDTDFGSSDDNLADQIICNTDTDCDGLTIGQLADEANLIIGGCEGTTGIDPGVIAECVMLINENFSDGEVNNGLVCAP